MRSSGKWDDISDVGHARHEEQQTLETETETGVRRGTEFAGVEVPPVLFLRHAQFVHTVEQFLVVSLTLGAADDFTDGRVKIEIFLY